MKTRIFVLITGVLLSAVSCVTDWGIFNPGRVLEEDLVTLHVWRYVTVHQIDNEKVDWVRGSDRHSIVKIPPGVHTLYVTYSSDIGYTIFPVRVTAQFERGNTYILKFEAKRIERRQILEYHVFLYNDKREGKEVTIDTNSLQERLGGDDSGVLPRYIKNVLNPTLDEAGHSVKLENDKFILVLMPDMAYTLTNKETEITTEGRAGFSMDLQMTNGKVFLLETDISKMSREQFLESNYGENSQTILVPVDCSETKVTYRYEKPLELQGSEITFSISEMQ